MKKLLCCLLGICTVSVFAANSSAPQSMPSATTAKPASPDMAKMQRCSKLREQAKATHEKVMEAFDENNACKIGKLQLQNKKLFLDNPDCFPQMQAQFRHQKNAAGKPNSSQAVKR